MCSFASIIFCVLYVKISYNFKVLSNCVIENPICSTFFQIFVNVTFTFRF